MWLNAVYFSLLVITLVIEAVLSYSGYSTLQRIRGYAIVSAGVLAAISILESARFAFIGFYSGLWIHGRQLNENVWWLLGLVAVLRGAPAILLFPFARGSTLIAIPLLLAGAGGAILLVIAFRKL